MGKGAGWCVVSNPTVNGKRGGVVGGVESNCEWKGWWMGSWGRGGGGWGQENSEWDKADI